MKDEPVCYEVPVYSLQLVQEGSVKAGLISGPNELALTLKDVARSDREQMVAVFLNTKNQPVGRQTVSIGTLNASLVHPREVFKAALLSNTNSLVLVHNHPSGDLTPSKEDDEITERIARAGTVLGVSLLDHVILAPDGRFYSYKDEKPQCLEGGHDL